MIKKNLSFFLFLTIALSGITACKSKKTADLKIMSYNIRHGLGLDTILDLSRSADIIRSQSPDLCALQEIDQFCARTDSVSQTDYLAQHTSLTGTFGKFMDYQGGEYGMASLTAKPILTTKVLALPDGKYEPRSSIVQEIQISESCTITFANVHFDWIQEPEGSTNRLKQAKALIRHIDSIGRASLITGDFNCTPDSPTMQYFVQKGFVFVNKGKDNLSFQGTAKTNIDHLIYRDSEKVQFKTKEVQLLNEPVVSDHRPLIAELEVVY